ncbi:MAG: hypothetical protein FD161_2160 [Limisphaerales bacterium]|nr:MAG: hypothetical protein FD161_2160 [Limisphaerales bacterium]KAG0508866.1 MAG: hypothetical protein E1N63_1962 [Limisphaerales bacterium]TXT50207.1 MAG: hypothetical protein FD140_2475 [Limisphaerales bacterium]
MAAPAEPSLGRRIALRLGRAVLVAAVVLALLSMTGSVPNNLGLIGGKLAPCPDSPNCVSSLAADAGRAVAPFALDRSLGAAKEELRQAAAKLPRAKLITERENYLHFEFRSLIFRFVDDVEFHLDAATKTIHVRSASRVGHSDFGVNRRRVEAIRALLPEAMRSAP